MFSGWASCVLHTGILKIESTAVLQSITLSRFQTLTKGLIPTSSSYIYIKKMATILIYLCILIQNYLQEVSVLSVQGAVDFQ